MTEPSKDQVARALTDLQEKGVTTWPAMGMWFLKNFGLGAGAVVALLAVLAFISWILWGHMVAQQKEITAVRVEQIGDLRKASDDKSEMVKATSGALTESAKASEKLSKSIDDLRDELRRPRN